MPGPRGPEQINATPTLRQRFGPAPVAAAEPLTPGVAVIIGAQGGIGAALLEALTEHWLFDRVYGFGRRTQVALDLLQESSIEAAAAALRREQLPISLIINATGVLSGDGCCVEKALRELDPVAMAHAYAINAIGPALLMKHLLPLLPKQRPSVFASLSARVGSIGDNQLGGWYSYRASKAALNQLLHTAAIELRRMRPAAICVAIHPGTVDTPLSAPFAKKGLDVQTPAHAAQQLLTTLSSLDTTYSGSFVDQRGKTIPW